MKIKGVLSERDIKKGRSFQLVYEWEDLIAAQLQIPIYKSKKFYHFFLRNINRIRCGWLFRLIDFLRPVRKYYLYFDMEATSYLRLPSIKNLIPIYIDFWLLEPELESFYKIHSNSKLILLTSKEVFEFLKKNGCPIPIFHFPLSLPDKYISLIDANNKRSIDFLFAGRKDPIFFDFVQLYEKDNPHIEYIYQEIENNIAYYVSNKRGKLPENYNSRQGYNQLLKSSKVAFYSTPGNDPAKKGANGYNQVTPRFLELISNGCLVMARYQENSDVNFYKLKELCFKVNSYQDFIKYARQFLDQEFVCNHINKYYPYLKVHSTSSRVDLLRSILESKTINLKK